MFHTFNLCDPINPPSPGKHRKTSSQPQSQSTADFRRACEECRRRKIRCNRSQPCQACLYYRKPKLCRYAEAKPSQSKLAAVGRQYRAVLERLFPSSLPESLFYLSRDELVSLILQDQNTHGSESVPESSPTPEVYPPSAILERVPSSCEDECLEVLQPMPGEGADGRESETPDLGGGISDDVNALSFSSRQPSCYLGISSINAVVKVMMWIDPTSLSRPPTVTREPPQSETLSTNPHPVDGPEKSQGRVSKRTATTDAAFSRSKALELFDAYFAYVHPFMPMLDESQFRSTYLSGQRQDERWKALLNTVFALGSALQCSADNSSHSIYFQRVREFLNIDSLGKLHIETVQTLGLIAGHYLHFVSQPNLAYSLMGAALRMATALGLHREFADPSPFPPDSNGQQQQQQYAVSIDVRRRVWWSLFCMDTWGCMTLGRPTLGRWGGAITVKPPCSKNATLSSTTLTANIQFCAIATTIQDALATSPQIPYPDLIHLDTRLTDWYTTLPSILHDPTQAQNDPSIATVQTNLRWRFLNARMLLHRPALLSYAMRRTRYTTLRAEEKVAIEKCRSVARDTIYSISETRLDNPTAAWGSVWYILQASMVPLLGLFVGEFETTSVLQACQEEVEVTIDTLGRLEARTPTARRVRDVVVHIRDACPPRTRFRGQGKRDGGDMVLDREEEDVIRQPPLVMDDDLTDEGGTEFGDSGCASMGPDPSSFVLPGDQNMWDYISWAGNNPWSGLVELQLPDDLTGAGAGMDWAQGVVEGASI